MTLPNFFIIGAMKCGTTSLHRYLAQHPQIFMSSIKEPNYFAAEGEEFVSRPDGRRIREGLILTLGDYQGLFANVTDEIAIGESTVGYLYNPRTPERIKKLVPHARHIAVLRDPVERAHSHFQMRRRMGVEPEADFYRAFMAEEDRIAHGWDPFSWSYKSVGMYTTQLERLVQAFKPEQIRVFIFEDLKFDSRRLMLKIFQFLQVDSTFDPDVSRLHRVGGVPRNKSLVNFLHQNKITRFIHRSIALRILPRPTFDRFVRPIFYPKPALPSDVRAELIEVYREDVHKLQDMLDRDLSAWIKV